MGLLESSAPSDGSPSIDRSLFCQLRRKIWSPISSPSKCFDSLIFKITIVFAYRVIFGCGGMEIVMTSDDRPAIVVVWIAPGDGHIRGATRRKRRFPESSHQPAIIFPL